MAIFAAVVGLGLAVDQATKWQAFNFLSREPSAQKGLIPRVLSLTAMRHEGAAFGLLHGRFVILVAISALAMVIVTFMAATTRSKLQATGLGLIGGGALGNFVDRVCLGHVRDFIDFSFWPTFNAADSLITIGVIVLIWQATFCRSRPKKSSLKAQVVRE